MNTLKKLTVATVLGVVTLGSAAFVCAEAPHGGVNQSGLNVTAAMAAADQQIACDLTEQMRTSLEAPRAATVRQEPSVSISELADVVVVAATRLPALDPIEVARVGRSAQARL